MGFANLWKTTDSAEPSIGFCRHITSSPPLLLGLGLGLGPEEGKSESRLCASQVLVGPRAMPWEPAGWRQRVTRPNAVSQGFHRSVLSTPKSSRRLEVLKNFQTSRSLRGFIKVSGFRHARALERPAGRGLPFRRQDRDWSLLNHWCHRKPFLCWRNLQTE